MTRYQIDGNDFPKDPLTKRWGRQQVATGGTGAPIYSAFWRCELSFPQLETDTEVNFFQGYFQAGGLHSVVLPHPRTGTMTGFTGVAFTGFDYEYGDVNEEEFTEPGVRIVFEHINLGATGTV